MRPYITVIAKNGKLSEKEMKEIFMHIDSDNDGSVQKDECFEFLSQIIDDPSDERFQFNANMK